MYNKYRASDSKDKQVEDIYNTKDKDLYGMST